jgi:hypothetical protein
MTIGKAKAKAKARAKTTADPLWGRQLEKQGQRQMQ